MRRLIYGAQAATLVVIIAVSAAVMVSWITVCAAVALLVVLWRLRVTA